MADHCRVTDWNKSVETSETSASVTITSNRLKPADAFREAVGREAVGMGLSQGIVGQTGSYPGATAGRHRRAFSTPAHRGATHLRGDGLAKGATNGHDEDGHWTPSHPLIREPMPHRLQPWIDWLRDQTTERTVLGAKVLLILLAVWLYLDLSDRAAQSRLAARNAERRAEALTGLDAEAVWTERAARTDTLLTQWRGTLWRAETSGIAAARIQSALETMAEDSGLDRIKAEVTPEPLMVDGQALLRFDFNGRGDTPALLRMVAAVGLHSPRLIAAEANLPLSRRRTSLRLSGFAVYQKGAAQTGADGAEKGGGDA